MSKVPDPSVRLRVVLAPGVGIDPGKADLLAGVHETGSIAAAGRQIGMSYKRAWLLVAALNSHFPKPLIEASKGGRSGGGARLTALGAEVLACYREMEQTTETAVTPILRRLSVLQSGKRPVRSPRRSSGAVNPKDKT